MTKTMFDGDELALSVWKSKYALDDEEHYDQMHKRMAKEFARIEKKYHDLDMTPIQYNELSKYGRERGTLNEGAIYDLFKDFKYIIPQGSIMSQLGSPTLGSLSNCFVVGQPEDSFGGIFNKDEQLAQLMKRRGGVGIDLSKLRPDGAGTSNVAKTSTGAVSFMERYSNTTREVAQNGRRGALMISLDIDHPDSLEFIKAKRDLSKVTGANISVKLNKKFMEAVDKSENYFDDYILKFPVDAEVPDAVLGMGNILNRPLMTDGKDTYWRSINAKAYWDEIIKSAHSVAEPGLMFWDNMVDNSPDGVYPEYRPITTNPCSEIAMQEYDACRLIAVNLSSFVSDPFTENARFNYDKFYKINYEAMRLSDDLIDLELEHIERILEKIKYDPEELDLKAVERDLWENIYLTAKSSRRTGLGFTGLGDMFAKLGQSYGGEDSLFQVKDILVTKMLSELDCTTDMAITRGTFKGWDPKLEKDNKFYEKLDHDFHPYYDRMQKHGRRNVSWSTVAPTGTVSILAQTTSGIEPLFQPFYTRRKKVNPNDKDVKIDFVDKQGDSWTEFQVLHPTFKDWLFAELTKPYTKGYTGDIPLIDEMSTDTLQEWFDQSPWYGSTANDIDWQHRVQMQSIIQEYITHSISSTINLPKDVSEQEVSDIYLESWKSGLKGITVYRDGSRDGVLITNNETKPDEFTYTDAKKRPKALSCDIHITKYRGTEFVVLVGLYHGKPYEVFSLVNEWNIKPSVGELVKVSRGKYNLNIKDDVLIEDVTVNMNHEEEVVTRFVSMTLRHGADIKFVTEQLNKSKGDITAFSKSIARVLNKYVKLNEQSGQICPTCSLELVSEDGCLSCKGCGYSRCG